jgi:hypothetical protein
MPSLTSAELSSALAAARAAAERRFAGSPTSQCPRVCGNRPAEHMITSTAIAIHKIAEPRCVVVVMI